MARFSIRENGDGNSRSRGSTSEIQSSKRIRLSAPLGNTATASSSNSGSLLATNNLMRPLPISTTPQPQLGGGSRIQEQSAIVEEEQEQSGSENEQESESYGHVSSEEERGQDAEMGTPEPRVSSTPNINGGSIVESVQPRGSSQARISVTLEPDVLDCPICFEPLKLPVYQCDNGHVACESCCKKMKNKCAVCCLPIGYNRCRALEKVIESVLVRCPNMVYGCGETIKYGNKSDHVKTCEYAPCSCPFVGCYHSGFYKDFYPHFRTAHLSSYTEICFDDAVHVSMNNSESRVILLEKSEGIVFILHRHVEQFGMYAYIACIAPMTSHIDFHYELSARDGNSYIKLGSFAENIPRWTEHHWAKKCIFVPDTFMEKEPEWEITIWWS